MPWRHLCEVLLCHICNNCICVFLQDVVTNPQAVDRAVLLSVSSPAKELVAHQERIVHSVMDDDVDIVCFIILAKAKGYSYVTYFVLLHDFDDVKLKSSLV